MQRIAELESENRQLYNIIRETEMVEEECAKILSPLVGYDREKPYALRLPEAVCRLSVKPPHANQGLHRYDYKNENGKLVEVRKEEVYVYTPVNVRTGEVELEDIRKFDDELETCNENWEWRKFNLILSET